MRLNQLKLKIKIKSLAEEARIIRFHENKLVTPDPAYSNVHPVEIDSARGYLRDHRVRVVRKESRSANIAYGYLRGKAYKQLESSCKEEPDIARVVTIINTFRYWSRKKPTVESIKEWMEQPYQVEIKVKSSCKEEALSV